MKFCVLSTALSLVSTLRVQEGLETGTAIYPVPVGSLDLPLHVVIETPKPDVGRLRATIQNNSASSFHRPRVTFVTYGSDADIERSPHGVPVLRSMFEKAISTFPHASTYTYVNSDIAVDSSFLETADAVARAVQKKVLRDRFLVVGRRTNVNWTRSMDISDSLVESEIPKGELFRADAEDYMMVSAGSFDWSSIPPFIVGHRGFDNWLVSRAATDGDMDAVDATETLRAIHMTDERVGNKEGAGASPDGTDYNMKFFPTGFFNWKCSTSAAVQWTTKINADGLVELKTRNHAC